jgi:hypothetical protein
VVFLSTAFFSRYKFLVMLAKAQEQSFCGWLLRAWDMRNLSLLFGSSLVPVFS